MSLYKRIYLKFSGINLLLELIDGDTEWKTYAYFILFKLNFKDNLLSFLNYFLKIFKF